MAIVMRSGPAELVARVRADFEEHGVTAEVRVGSLRELAKQDNQGEGRANRIVICPFIPETGDGGKIVPPVNVGPREIFDTSDPPKRIATVRAIGDWERQMVAACWARDHYAPDDEEAQLIAVEQLAEETNRAINASGLADIVWGPTKWVLAIEPFFGFEVRLQFAFTHPIFDRPLEVGYPQDVTVNRRIDDAAFG